jgi:tRNA pseudouridine32 synthase / 23S rRNA pseudouridine746 synthase
VRLILDNRAVQSPLPIVDGVTPSSQWLPRGSWPTILDFLKERFSRVPVETWMERMAAGEVRDATRSVITADTRYCEGMCIFYYRSLEDEPHIPFTETILYEDEHILVVDKPHFLPVVPAGRFLQETLLVRLRNQGRRETIAPVHRLDRETAGVVLFSTNIATRRLYTELFRERRVIKLYEVLAENGAGTAVLRRSRIVRGEPFFRMCEVEGVSNAETHIEELDRTASGYTRYRLRPTTGKKHQLRVHLAAMGMPILNDRLYPVYLKERYDNDDFSCPLQLLARSLAFVDPVSGRQLYFESKQTLAE